LSDFKNAVNDVTEQTMEENFTGYLLNALDPEEARQVEAYLAQHADGERKLELLRQALQPLFLDSAETDPPRGLADRTLAFVARHAQAAPPRRPRPARTLAFPALLGRRVDVLIAACLLIIVGGVGVTWVRYLHILQEQAVCKNDLQTIYQALATYENTHKHLPNVHTVAKPPYNVAGMVVPKLISTGHLPPNFTIQCPGGKNVAPISYEQALQMSEKEFEKMAGNLTPCYGFTLGYKDRDGSIHGPQFGKGGSMVIILMADSPPANPLTGNSPNHAGRGQNVLFLNGNVKFITDRAQSIGGDDLYLNNESKVEAGVGWGDNVIGHSRARP
jgi:hypothetical protein